MQNKLLSTTALVAATFLVGPLVADKASAADPLELKIGGYMNAMAVLNNWDDGAGEPGENLQEFLVNEEGEIQFTAKTTLDNGLEVGVRVEFEAANQGGGASIVDERYVWFEGDFGIIRIGSDDNAAYQLHYISPAVTGAMVDSPTHGYPTAGGNLAALGTFTTANLGGDGQKIMYFSPRFSGFQLALSYQKDEATIEGAGGVSFVADDDSGGQEDIWAVGANFVESFNGVDVAISGGYARGTVENNAAFTAVTIVGTATVGGEIVLTFGTTVVPAGLFADR